MPRLGGVTIGGRGGAVYHFYGTRANLCKDSNCMDFNEIRNMINELIEVDVGFRREWHKRFARYARVPQWQRQRAEYRRKRG